ncbi:MAG: putative 2OG-Fe(II) oxygenase [Parvularculaceae bacterium]
MAQLSEMTRKAQALKAEGRHAEAVDMLKAMVDAAPHNIAVLHNYAAALGDAGQNREAVRILRRAFELGLNAPESWLVYARALSGIHEFKEAQAAFLQLLRLRPLDHEAHRELAQLIWMQTGNRDKALAVLNKAIEANPSVAGLHIARAQVFGQTGDAATEYAITKEAARLSGDPMLEFAACNAALADKKFEQAVAHGRRAAKALPDETGAGAAYCSALLAVGEAAEAVRIAEGLRAKDPMNQFFIALQATAWRLLGDERYHAFFDYDALVQASPLDTPKGWINLDAYLADLIEGLDYAHRFKTHPFYQSVRHGSQISSIDGSDHPALRAYKEAAAGPVERYVKSLAPGDDPLRARNIGGSRIFSTWSIRLPPKGFHVNHVHPEGWLSSACHLRPAEKDPASEKAGWFKLGEPGVATAPSLEPERFIEPKPGVMVIFPSYMWHGTVEFTAGNSRLTVAADIVPAAPDAGTGQK